MNNRTFTDIFVRNELVDSSFIVVVVRLSACNVLLQLKTLSFSNKAHSFSVSLAP